MGTVRRSDPPGEKTQVCPPLLAEWLGILGSAGGPESASTPLGIALLLTPSVLLAPAFVVMMIGVRYLIPEARQICAQAAVAFAKFYATQPSGP